MSLYVEQGRAEPAVTETLRRFLRQAKPGDYVALLAYLTEEPEVTLALEALRQTLRERVQATTTLGYGPRYLHSTGQIHKGGPNTGLYLLLTTEDRVEPPVPGRPYSFGVLKRAQALGDLESLRNHGRRVVRVYLRENVPHALSILRLDIESALPRGKS